MDASIYVCPRSGDALRRTGSFLCNGAGEVVAHSRRGVFCFDSASSAEEEATLAQLNRLCEAAEAVGWRKALDECYDQAFVQYVTSPARTTFIDQLPITSTSDLLELGPGLGQFTGLLAKRSRFVDALEVVPGQASFASLRLAQDGVQNVRIAAGGSNCRLPYRREAFDGVVLNLVFEWCAARAGLDHQVVQTRLLHEMHRVLRPGGFLYLATKNRFGISYVCGKPDEHFDGMRFGSALPRALASRLLGRRPPGRLYSYSGLRRMLESNGFGVEKGWWAAPDYRSPVQLVDTDGATVEASRRAPGFVAGRSRLERLALGAMPSAWVKHFMPGLNFLAVKKGS